jgi:hypothetical protein
MYDTPDRHDARALALIDQGLSLGRFSEWLVTQVAEAFAAAEQAERTTGCVQLIHPASEQRWPLAA